MGKKINNLIYVTTDVADARITTICASQIMSINQSHTIYQCFCVHEYFAQSFDMVGLTF